MSESRKVNKPEFVEYHRPPTAYEVRFGEGAEHYRDFPRHMCSKPDGTLKKWFIAPDDGLRYYR